MNRMEKLIEAFRKFPSVGPKQAERFAMYIMRADPSEINSLIEAVINAKNEIKFCRKCNNYSADDLCDICSDLKRDSSTICVVENPFDIIAIEKTKSYNGVYYVIGSYIIPHYENNAFLSRMDKLIQRVKEEKINEIIIALNTTTEGQATALYIKKNISDYVNKVSRIAFGVPMGADIDYIDEYTLGYALKGRTPITDRDF